MNLRYLPPHANAYSLPAGRRLSFHLVRIAATPVQVIDLKAGVASSNPGPLFAGTDRLYFSAESATGLHVWSTDGTAAGTIPLLGPVNNELPSVVGVAGNRLYLAEALQIHTSDGTPGNDVLLGTMGFDQYHANLTVDGSRVYFNAAMPAGSSVVEVWTSDGTAQGTIKLTNHIFNTPSPVVILAHQAYFDSASNGLLYATDGTAQGTHSLARTGVSTAIFPSNGSLLLLASPSEKDPLLWKSSGGAEAPTVVKHLPSGFAQRRDAVSTGPLLFFPWLDSQLWKSDGTADGTVLIKSFGSRAFNDLGNLVPLGDRIVFAVDDGSHGFEPWVSDGTPEGTKMLRDISTGSASSTPYQFVVADGLVYFVATDSDHGRELWQTDGTPEGTQLAADVNPGPDSSDPYYLTPFHNVLYFAATTPASGRELWAYPLPNQPAITIDDARANENAGNITLPVRLTRAADHRITVDYETADGSATAAHDYTAGSGTIAFEVGETSKNIVVAIADDTAPGTTRSFAVRLKNATAPLARTAGAAVIDDDDILADTGVSLDRTTTGSPRLTVRNAGPSPATNIILCAAVPPFLNSVNCGDPSELASGESRDTPLQETDGLLLAKVTQWQTDSQPANNTVSWLRGGINALAPLYVSPATPRAGQGVTLQVPGAASAVVSLTSSDLSVLAVPASVTIPTSGGAAVVTLTALKAGTAIISRQSPNGPGKVTVRVLSTSETARMVAFVSGGPSEIVLPFASNMELKASVGGITLDGILPTGSVTFLQDGQTLATAQLVNQKATINLLTPPVGSHSYSVVYSGDATFFDAQSAEQTAFVNKRSPSVSATFAPGGSSVQIAVRGVSGYAPSGTVSVTENGDNGSIPRSVAGPLVANGDASSVIATGFSAAARTVTISYSGDSNYNALSSTVTIVGPHTRSVRH